MDLQDAIGEVLEVAADACFLINFLTVDRIDLLARRLDYRIHVPLEVD
nr:hypothetical protein [Chloroflexota bacterium]